MKRILTLSMFFAVTYFVQAQVGIGNPLPDASAQLDITSPDKGLLIPRVALTDMQDATTINSGNVISLMVYNTTNNTNITPGYFYWNGTAWSKLATQTDLSALETLTSFSVDEAAGMLTYIDEAGTNHVFSLATLIQGYETTTTLAQNTATSQISYTDENGVVAMANVVSAETDNLLTVGGDGGALLDPSAIVIPNETTTQLIQNNGNGQITYTNEDGDDNIANVVSNDSDNLLIVGTDGGAYLESEAIPEETITELAQSNVTGQITYTNENGDDAIANVISTETNNSLTVGADGGAFFNANGLDETDDAWINNATENRVELATLSDGTTARTDQTQVSILDNGNMGIGTTSPNFKLDVSDTSNPGFTHKIVTHGRYTGHLRQNETTLVSGYGIGLANSFGSQDAFLLRPEGAGRTFERHGIAFGVGRLSSNNEGTMGLFTTDGSQLQQRILIDKAGMVGIDTDQPTEKLDVNGKVRVRDLSGTTAATDLLVVADATTGELKARTSISEDLTDDAWENTVNSNPNIGRVGLTSLSDGTARPTDKLFNIYDNGRVAIGAQIEGFSATNPISAFMQVTRPDDGPATAFKIAGNANTNRFMLQNTKATGQSVNEINFDHINIPGSNDAAIRTVSNATDVSLRFFQNNGIGLRQVLALGNGNSVMSVGKSNEMELLSNGNLDLNSTATDANARQAITFDNTTGGSRAVELAAQREALTQNTFFSIVTRDNNVINSNAVFGQGSHFRTGLGASLVDQTSFEFDGSIVSGQNPPLRKAKLNMVSPFENLAVFSSQNFISNKFILENSNRNVTADINLEFNNTFTSGVDGKITSKRDNAFGLNDGYLTLSTLRSSVETERLELGRNGNVLKAGNTAGQELVLLEGTGYVGIGTDAPTEKLEVVGGNIKTDGSLISGTNTYPDYVFDAYENKVSKMNTGYTFKTLKEVEVFITKNKHLPGVAGIEDLKKTDEGYEVNTSKLSIQTLEKVEELYLHTIAQQKIIEMLSAEKKKLEERLIKIEKALVHPNE